MKNIIRAFIFFGSICLGACKSTHKVVNTPAIVRDTITKVKPQDTIVKRQDTASVAKLNPWGNLEPVWNAAVDHSLKYTTLKGKMSASIESPFLNQSVTVNIRMRKNTTIWLSVSKFGMEAARVLIRKDSLFLINKLQKKYEVHPFSYLQKLTNVPFTFADLQGFFTGQPIFVNGSMQKAESGAAMIRFLFVDGSLKNTASLNTASHNFESFDLVQTLHQKIYRCVINYSNYTTIGNASFPNDRNLVVNGNNKIQIDLSYKNVEIDKPLDFPFYRPSF